MPLLSEATNRHLRGGLVAVTCRSEEGGRKREDGSVLFFPLLVLFSQTDDDSENVSRRLANLRVVAERNSRSCHCNT
ncbi:hypothetical protein O3P69_016600 [Scylla paramamosain]|uniref:Uncharacterized protein n=1 Tax=Scylla paramamosain TaxID=85552 RepID=A0AAW0SZF0_SCYPA